MSTCDELYHRHPGLTERIASSFADQMNRLANSFNIARELYVRQRRLRATEIALDSLPDDIRCDIGWPDLYERQIEECNKLKLSRH